MNFQKFILFLLVIFLVSGCIDTYRVNVLKMGSGTGTVTTIPEGINCGSYCSAVFQKDSQVKVFAVPNSDSRFVGWGGDCRGFYSFCILNMTSNKNVTAFFQLNNTNFSMKDII